MAKTWTPDHVRLAGVVAVVRRELRRIAAAIGGQHGDELGRLAAALTTALKARSYRREARGER
jgi:hypothetical protein